MFKKILIANRGEIACRIIRSAKRLGIRTVAVYAEPDADSLHVQMADEAYPIGPAAARESYLNIKKIVAVARKSKAEAVHPGFGFLSENTAFAEALAKAKIVFIGPSPHAIAAMGDKIQSKKLAAKAKINTVPGYVGVIDDKAHAVKIARDIGYPVMIKASAGGGGKGMRIARDDSEVEEGFVSAANEARSSFGDDRVFIEKFVEQPRHIEIQILADHFGNTIHLGERECSIQRRHQKVVEESPSVLVDAALRQRMGKQAVQLAKAVGYASAGTVEFIVGPNRDFYFLEMNTRLQVEHPVTEMVTGIDIVEEMIRIAFGEKLRYRQSDITLTGSAIEVRVYAEDPERGFLPSTGRLVRYREPAGEGIRVDAGVAEGSEITMFYDPMIAKLVTYGRTRIEAIGRMQGALDSYVIRGLDHNLGFLASVMAKKRFKDGRLTTHFIDEEYPDGFSSENVRLPDESLLPAVAAVAHVIDAGRDRPGEANGRERAPLPEEWHVMAGKLETIVRVGGEWGTFEVVVGKSRYEIETAWHPGLCLMKARIGGKPASTSRSPGSTSTRGISAASRAVASSRGRSTGVTKPERTQRSPSKSRIAKPMRKTPQLLRKARVELALTPHRGRCNVP